MEIDLMSDVFFILSDFCVSMNLIKQSYAACGARVNVKKDQNIVLFSPHVLTDGQ